MILNNNYKQHKIDRIISDICDYEYEYFLNKKNVQGIGLGYKIKNGFYTFQKCIQVFVSRKISPNNILMKDLIPKVYRGIPTDVMETGIFTTSSLTDKIRPTIGGYVIGNEYIKEDSGTLGCLVTDGKNLFILSNNHTLCALNKAPIGTKIIQPSFNYGGDFKTDTIATLSKYIPIKPKTFFRKPTNYVDCAIAKVVDISMVSPKISMIGDIQGTTLPKLNENVTKVGFTTGFTTGHIISVNSTIEVDNNKTLFKKQIIASKMDDSGDSGAILLNTDVYAIGLLMGSSSSITVYNQINIVLEKLNVHLVTK